MRYKKNVNTCRPEWDRVRLQTQYDADAHKAMRKSLQLAPFRASYRDTWPSGHRYRLHTNWSAWTTPRSTRLQERLSDTTQDHGFFIENADAATKLKTEFLDEQWSNSKHAAICDHDW